MLNTIQPLSRLLAWVDDELNIPGKPTTSHCQMLTPYLQERCLPLTSRCSATGRTQGYLTSSKAFFDTVSTVQVPQRPVQYNSVLPAHLLGLMVTVVASKILGIYQHSRLSFILRSKHISTGLSPFLRKIMSQTPFFISSGNLLLLGMNDDYHSLKECSLLEGIV